MQFATLAVSLLIASPSSAAIPASAELMLQSQQRLTGMRESLGLDENHSFQLKSLEQDARGQTHVRFQQIYHGVRIWGGEVITHTKADGTELPPTTALKQDIQVDIKPKLSTAEALAVVKTDLAPRFDFAYKPLVELVVYPEKASRVLAPRPLSPKRS